MVPSDAALAIPTRSALRPATATTAIVFSAVVVGQGAGDAAAAAPLPVDVAVAVGHGDGDAGAAVAAAELDGATVDGPVAGE